MNAPRPDQGPARPAAEPVKPENLPFTPWAAKPGFSPAPQEESKAAVSLKPSVRHKGQIAPSPPSIDEHHNNFPYFILDVSFPPSPSASPPQVFKCKIEPHVKNINQLCTYLPRHTNCLICLNCVQNYKLLPSKPKCLVCCREYSPEELELIRANES